MTTMMEAYGRRTPPCKSPWPREDLRCRPEPEAKDLYLWNVPVLRFAQDDNLSTVPPQSCTRGYVKITRLVTAAVRMFAIP